MNENQRVEEIISRLLSLYPDAGILLKFSNPLELLVSTILSAQSTDRQVNKVTELLFKKYKTVEDYAYANPSELEQDIYSTGFYRNKSKSIIGAANVMIERFDGKVPKTMEEILQLPGVARKTGNIVLGNAYGVVVGMAVDTHVKRLSNRLGLSSQTDPEKIEQDLMRKISRDMWFKTTYLLIEHGRAICTAKKPNCMDCVLNDICPSAFMF